MGYKNQNATISKHIALLVRNTPSKNTVTANGNRPLRRIFYSILGESTEKIVPVMQIRVRFAEVHKCEHIIYATRMRFGWQHK